MCNIRFSQSNSSKKLYYSKSGWELTLDTKDNSKKRRPWVKQPATKATVKRARIKFIVTIINEYKRNYLKEENA